MRVLVTAVSRFTVPTGVCRVAANHLRCLLQMDDVDPYLAVGEWQADYYATKLLVPPDRLLPVSELQNTWHGRNSWYLFRLPKFVNKNRFDIVHLSYPVPVLSRLISVPVVGTVHDMYAFDEPSNFSFAFANRTIFRLFAQQAHALICASDQTLTRLRFHMPQLAASSSVSRIYNPLLFEEDSQEATVPEFIKTNPEKFLLVCAQHRKPKNLDIVLNALPEILEHDPALRLVIVGSEGTETPALQKIIAQLKLQKHVLMLSSLKECELRYLYRNCQALVVASRAEGFCCPVVEALRENTPVVCSDIQVLHEVGGINCTYFSLEGSAKSNLAAAIRQAVEKPRGPSHGLSRFSAPLIRDQLFGLYRSVLERSVPS